MFDFETTATCRIGLVEKMADGGIVVGGYLKQDPVVEGLNVKIHIFVWGATFEDSTVDWNCDTESFVKDNVFEGGGAIYPYKIIMSKERVEFHGPCHTVEILQNGVKIGGI